MSIPGAIDAAAAPGQDEMVFILRGEPTLRGGDGETVLRPGMCAGFAAGGVVHQLRNDTAKDVVFLEIGDRTPGDEVSYPEDDLKVATGKDGTRYAAHKTAPLTDRTPRRVSLIKQNRAFGRCEAWAAFERIWSSPETGKTRLLRGITRALDGATGCGLRIYAQLSRPGNYFW